MDRRPSADIDRIHVARRVQHAVTGIVFILISYIIPPYPFGSILLLLVTIAFYSIHKKRVINKEWDDWYLKNFGSLLRNHERGEWDVQHKRKSIPSLPGAFFFLLGSVLATLLFPATVARTSVLVLSISDPVAGLVGSWLTVKRCNIAWKQLLTRSNAANGPTVAGSVGFLLSTIICLTLGGTSLSFNSRLLIGIVASVAEALGQVDDNVIIPLVVGFLICALHVTDE